MKVLSVGFLAVLCACTRAAAPAKVEPVTPTVRAPPPPVPCDLGRALRVVGRWATGVELEHLALAPDGDVVLLQGAEALGAFSTKEGTLRWSLRQFADPKVLLPDLSMRGAMSGWSGDGKTVVTLQTHAQYVVLDGKTGAILSGRTGAGPARLLAVAPSGAVVSSNSSGSLAVRSASLDQLDVRSGITEEPRGLAVSDDGQRVLIGGKRAALALSAGETAERLSGHRAEISAVALSGSGTQGASGDSSGHVLLWDLAATPASRPVEPPMTRNVGALAFSNDGAWLAAGDWGGHVRLVKVKDASVTQDLEVAGDQSSTAVVAVQFCRAACCLVVGTGDGVVVRLEP